MNRLKKGLAYISERTGQLRFSDKNKDEKWLQPLAEYVPLVKIKRGQPVSIALVSDLVAKEEELGLEEGTLTKSSISYVTLTNPSKHTHAVGLAMEACEGVTAENTEPDPIHIITNGKFLLDIDYLIKSHQITEDEVSDVVANEEYVPDFLNNYSENIGKTIYCKSNSDGILTIVPEEAYLAYNNVIQIGFVSDAWLDNKDNNIKNAPAAIEIQLDGDDRGILDATSFEAILGETVKIPKNENLRVFALGCEDDEYFKFKLGYKAPDNAQMKSGFIGLQRLDGKTAVIYINSEASTNHGIEDTAFLEVAKFFGDVTKYELNLSNLKLDNIATFWESLKEKLSSAMGEIAYLPDEANGLAGLEGYKGQESYSKITKLDIEDDDSASTYSRVSTFTADQVGGYYDIFISSELREYFQFVSVKSHGSYYNKGYAVLADIRNAKRQNILGIYCSGKYDQVLNKGTQAIFLKRGLYNTTKVLEPGSPYYLSNNGKISVIPQEYYNTIVKIGTAQTAGSIIVDASDPRQAFDGDIPVGYMKPSVHGEAEFGFALMDGKTALDSSKYSELLKRLKHWFTEEELKIQEYDFNGDGLTDLENTDNTTTYSHEGFVLPKVTYQSPVTGENETGYIPAQIKYLSEGVYQEIPREPFIRRQFDTCEEVDGIAQIPSIDITSLIVYGPESNAIYFPELETLDIRLFADLRDQKNATDRVWTEIRPGFHLFNNTEYYGFEWRIRKAAEPSVENPFGIYELYTVNCPKDNDGNALGPRYQETPFSPPESLAGHPLKIFIAKRDYYTRQFDVEALFQNYVKESVLDLSGQPWTGAAVSGNAIRKDIKTKVDTNRLIISDEENFNDDESTAGELKAFLKDSNVRFKTPEEEKDISSVVEGSFRLMEPSQVVKICLDYYKGFLKYTKEQSSLSDEQNSTDASDFVRDLKSDVWNLIPYKLLKTHEDLSVEVEGNNPHGIKNTGYSGNINASTLQSMHVGRPGAVFAMNDGDSTDTFEFDSYTRIIPFLKELENSQYEFVIGNRLVKQFIKTDSAGIPVSADNVVTEVVDANGNITETFPKATNGKVFKEIFAQGTDKEIKITYDVTNSDIILTDGDDVPLKLNGQSLGSSSRDYKKITKEFADSQFTNDWGTDYNEDTNEVGDRVADKLKNSALQAVYVLPLAAFRYQNEDVSLKRWFGLITERVEEAKSKLDDDITGKVVIKDENFGTDTDTGITFDYTDSQKESIKEWLEMITLNNKKAQNIQSSVGLLLEAAKETQERLLAVEASTFGKDSPTIPGSPEAPTDLPDYVTNLPTILGLNRLIKALCAEVFQDADPVKLASGEASLADYSRLDEIDKEINGEGAASTGKTDVGTHELIAGGAATYPTEEAIKNGTLEYTSRADAYEVTKDIIHDDDDFDKDLPIFQEKTDTGAYDAASTTGLSELTDTFDGLNEAVNRISYKLNKLTEEINGVDNITKRPEMLDKMRDNIETIIQELFDIDSYTDDGTINTKAFKKTALSRIDLAVKELYNYKLSLGQFRNVNDTAATTSVATDMTADEDNLREISARTFNGKKIRGDSEAEDGLLKEVRAAAPEAVKDWGYATIIDIIIDLIGKSEDNMLRENGTITEDTAIVEDETVDNVEKKYVFRHQETILERITQIEKVLDAISIRFRDINYFENDDKSKNSSGDAFTEIKNLDEFSNWIAKYLGIHVTAADNTSFLTDPKTDEDEFEELLNTSVETHLHNAVYDIAARLKAEESDTDAFNEALGSRYSITKADDDVIQENGLTVSDASKGKHQTQNSVGSDMNALIKLVYGTDSKVEDKDGEYNTETTSFSEETTNTDDFGTEGNALEVLYKELYNLPERYNKVPGDGEDDHSMVKVDKTKTIGAVDADHSSTVYYDMDNTEDGTKTLFDKKSESKNVLLANGNRNDYVQRTVYGKDENGNQITTPGTYTRVRKNRFEVLEDAIKAIRQLTGMASFSKTDFDDSFTGNIHIVAQTHTETAAVDIPTYQRADSN